MLPIGGIREKSLAAQRAGLKRIILPRDNEPDLAELPPETKKELEFVLVDTIDEVFEAAFDGKGAPAAPSERQVNLKVASSPSQARVSPPRS